MADGRYHILIVEDDAGLNQGIRFALQEESVRFSQAYTLKEARESWESDPADMVLLDVNLPDGNGCTLLREIRETSQIPVLLITANDLETDEVTGFALGADDYITKPFSLMALRARVARMRQRTGTKQGTKEAGPETKAAGYEDGRYRFHFWEMQFWADGEEIFLSRTEQKLLQHFVRNPGQTLPRERLMETVWTDGADYVDENALSVAVNRLRRKLEGRKGNCPIQTVYGIGYVWEKQG